MSKNSWQLRLNAGSSFPRTDFLLGHQAWMMHTRLILQRPSGGAANPFQCTRGTARPPVPRKVVPSARMRLGTREGLRLFPRLPLAPKKEERRAMTTRMHCRRHSVDHQVRTQRLPASGIPGLLGLANLPPARIAQGVGTTSKEKDLCFSPTFKRILPTVQPGHKSASAAIEESRPSSSLRTDRPLGMRPRLIGSQSTRSAAFRLCPRTTRP